MKMISEPHSFLRTRARACVRVCACVCVHYRDIFKNQGPNKRIVGGLLRRSGNTYCGLQTDHVDVSLPCLIRGEHGAKVLQLTVMAQMII